MFTLPAMNAEVKSTRETQVTGTELGKDLARFLAVGGDYMVWTQLPLGSVWFDRPGIVDILAIQKSWTRTNVKIYEIKVSRGDFFSDVKSGKYEKYLDCCTQFFFATPSKLVTKAEIPVGCGLITQSKDKGWRVIKTPNLRTFEWNEKILFKLLMRGFEEHFPKMREAERDRYEQDRDLLSKATGRGRELARRLAGAEEYIAGVDIIKDQLSLVLGEGGVGVDIANNILLLRKEVTTLLAKRLHTREAVEMADMTMSLFDGTSYPRGIAQRMRRIADTLDERE